MAKDFKSALIFWSIPFLFIILWYLKEIVLVFGLGIIWGLTIQFFALFLQRRIGTSFYFNIFLIYSLVVFLTILIFVLIFKIVIEELPNLLDKINLYFSLIEKEVKSFNLEQILNIGQISLIHLSTFVKSFSVFSGRIFEIVFIFAVSLYTALSKNFIYHLVKPLFFVSEENKEKLVKFLKMAQVKVAFWFLGQLTLMFFIGLATYIFVGLVLKIQYSALLGLVAGLFEIIPTFGTLFTLFLLSLVTFLDNPQLVFSVIIYFSLLQFFENNFLVPLVMRKAIDVHPLLVLLGFLVGAKIGGVLGIILILPLLGVLVELFKFLSREKEIIEKT